MHSAAAAAVTSTASHKMANIRWNKAFLGISRIHCHWKTTINYHLWVFETLKTLNPQNNAVECRQSFKWTLRCAHFISNFQLYFRVSNNKIYKTFIPMTWLTGFANESVILMWDRECDRKGKGWWEGERVYWITLTQWYAVEIHRKVSNDVTICQKFG